MNFCFFSISMVTSILFLSIKPCQRLSHKSSLRSHHLPRHCHHRPNSRDNKRHPVRKPLSYLLPNAVRADPLPDDFLSHFQFKRMVSFSFQCLYLFQCTNMKIIIVLHRRGTPSNFRQGKNTRINHHFRMFRSRNIFCE